MTKNTRSQELLDFCIRPRTFTEICEGGFSTMRGVMYRLERSGHIRRTEFRGRLSSKSTIQWQATGLPFADKRGRRRETVLPETGERAVARSGTYVSGAYLRRILGALEAGQLDSAKALVRVRLETAERQREKRRERDEKTIGAKK